jgi:hypothetical protein
VTTSARAPAVLCALQTGAAFHALPGCLVAEGRSTRDLRAWRVNAVTGRVGGFPLFPANARPHHDLAIDARRCRLGGSSWRGPNGLGRRSDGGCIGWRRGRGRRRICGSRRGDGLSGLADIRRGRHPSRPAGANASVSQKESRTHRHCTHEGDWKTRMHHRVTLPKRAPRGSRILKSRARWDDRSASAAPS